MQALMESCPGKTAVSGVMGFALGGAFGLFMASVCLHPSPNPTHILTHPKDAIRYTPSHTRIRRRTSRFPPPPTTTQSRSSRYGSIFAGTECCIEGFRAKNDLANGVLAGCITGGVLAAPAGPQAAALGCAGFAAFSAAIDAYMRRPSEVD